MKNHLTLTNPQITLIDEFEVAYLSSSSKFSKTTDQIISVDGIPSENIQ